MQNKNGFILKSFISEQYHTTLNLLRPEAKTIFRSGFLIINTEFRISGSVLCGEDALD